MPEFAQSPFDYAQVKGITNTLGSQTDWNIDTLTDFVIANPKSFKVIEGICQLQRFTDAQMTHFIFDIKKMNLPDIDANYEYAVINLKNDLACKKLFLKKAKDHTGKQSDLDRILRDPESYSKKIIVALFKMTASDYVSQAKEKFEILEQRIKRREFYDVATRFSNYVIWRLRLNDTLKSIDLVPFLETKRIPTDPKGLHGNYAKFRLTETLTDRGIHNIDSELLKADLGPMLPRKLNLTRLGLDPNRAYFCREKFVEGVEKPDGGGPKKFDFVVIVQGEPRHLFEVNFYSTTGTKIGINENEYVALNRSIRKSEELHFHWITDGNYWLSSDGRKRFARLLRNFGEIFNINTFSENLDIILR